MGRFVKIEAMQKVVNGVLTNYEIVGEGKKKLLILHGWKGSMDEWRNVADVLGKRYKVILLDLPGFGGSGMPPNYWGIFEYEEFVEKFLSSLGVKKILVLGHSFGGRIAIVLAAQTNLVERLILVDAAGMETTSLKSILATLLKPFKFVLPEGARGWFRSRDYKEAGALKDVFLKVISQQLQGELKRIFTQTQTLIVWGERDKVLPFIEARMLYKGIKGSVLRVVWGAGHWPHLEKPNEMLQILEEEGV